MLESEQEINRNRSDYEYCQHDDSHSASCRYLVEFGGGHCAAAAVIAVLVARTGSKEFDGSPGVLHLLDLEVIEPGGSCARRTKASEPDSDAYLFLLVIGFADYLDIGPAARSGDALALFRDILKADVCACASRDVFGLDITAELIGFSALDRNLLDEPGVVLGVVGNFYYVSSLSILINGIIRRLAVIVVSRKLPVLW